MSGWKVANRILQRNAKLPALYMAVDEQALTSGQALPRFTFRIKEADFLWTAAVAVSTGPFKTRIWSNRDDRYLDNDFTRSNNFWGQLGPGPSLTANAAAGKNPFAFPPKFFAKDSELGFELTDVSNSGNTVALYLIGQRAVTCENPTCDLDANKPCYCDRGRWGRGKGLFILNTGANGLTGSATGIAGSAPFNDSLTPDETYHFRVTAINSEATSDSWKADFEYQDVRHDRRVKPMSAQLRARAWTGTAVAPFYPPSPHVVYGGSAITFSGKELSGSANFIHLAMIGERVTESMLRREE